MPTHRPTIAQLSTSDVAWLAKRKPGSIRRQLETAGLQPVRQDGRTLLWDSRAAFRVLLDRNDVSAERARLDAAKADLAELDLKRRRGELVPADATDRVVIALATVVSSRIQSLPPALAPALAAEDSPQGCSAILEEAINRALNELADAALEAQERQRSRRKAE